MWDILEIGVPFQGENLSLPTSTVIVANITFPDGLLVSKVL